MQTLADSTGVVDADGDVITTGTAGMFAGFHTRSRQIPAAMRLDGWWFAARSVGDFQIQDPLGTHSSQTWVNYNPFEDGEPWASVVDADGNTVTHAIFTFEDGTSDYWRIVQTEQHAKDAATAVGESILCRAGQKDLHVRGVHAA